MATEPSTKRSWYRLALDGPSRPALAQPCVVVAAGNDLGAAIALAQRFAPGCHPIAADNAAEADIPLGEALGKLPAVALDVAEQARLLADVPRFHWPTGVLPQLSRLAGVRGVQVGWTVRPQRELLVIEAQPDDALLTELFLGLIERLPQADNLEIRLLDHFEDAGKAEVWLTSRVDSRRILRILDDQDTELANGHLEISVYVRALKGTLRLTEHKTVVWLAEGGALEAEMAGWLGELGVPRVDALPTIKDVPHYHYRSTAARDRKKLSAELYRQRLRRVG